MRQCRQVKHHNLFPKINIFSILGNRVAEKKRGRPESRSRWHTIAIRLYRSLGAVPFIGLLVGDATPVARDAVGQRLHQTGMGAGIVTCTSGRSIQKDVQIDVDYQSKAITAYMPIKLPLMRCGFGTLHSWYFRHDWLIFHLREVSQRPARGASDPIHFHLSAMAPRTENTIH